MTEVEQEVKVTRPDWDEYFLQGVVWVASRGDCVRSQTGAIIVKENRIMATGYNGGPSKGKSCLKGECPRGLASREEAPGSTNENTASYDEGPGACIALHAEQNAMLYCSLEQRQGATIYITKQPCAMCFREVRGSGIVRIVWPGGNYNRWINGRWYARTKDQPMDVEVA